MWGMDLLRTSIAGFEFINRRYGSVEQIDKSID